MDASDAAESPERAETVNVGVSPQGLESQLALEQGRKRLLGWTAQPTLIGRYEVQQRLGAGGMGVVYSARDPDLDRVVAVKILRSKLLPDSQGRARMVREAQALAKLSHPNVVHVYEVGRARGQVYIAMEYIEGQTLKRWVRRETPSLSEVLAKYVDAGRGLLAAHRAGVVHRDFKPDNVLVGDDGRVVVMDFGLARPSVEGETHPGDEVRVTSATIEQTPQSMTQTGVVMGTPAYMDPQQLMGTAADEFSDQFSFCVSLYESIHGSRPFAGNSATEAVRAMWRRRSQPVEFNDRSVPRRLRALLQRGLAYHRTQRFPSFEALLAELERVDERKSSRVRGWWAAVPMVLGGVALAWPAQPPAPVPIDPVDVHAEVVAQTHLPEPVETPLAKDPIGATVHRLDNGLTVYLVPRPGDPSVWMNVVIRAGASEEPDETPGVALLLSSAIWQGSKTFGVHDPSAEAPFLATQHESLAGLATEPSSAQRLERLKRAHAAHEQSAALLAPLDDDYIAKELGVRSRSTSVDVGTMFEVELPSGSVEGWMLLIADVLRRPAFRGVVLDASELLEVLPWYHDSETARTRMLGLLSGSHGKARDVAAEYASIQQVPFEAMRRFHATYYRPNNAAIVLVGNVSADGMLPIVDKAFGDWEPAPIPEPAALRDTPLLKLETMVEAVGQGPEEVWLGFTLPPATDGFFPNVAALISLLSGPRGVLDVRASQSEVFEEPWVVHDGRALIVAASVSEGAMPSQVETALLDSIATVARGELDRDVWSHSTQRWPLDAAHWDDSRSHLSFHIAESFLLHQEWADFVAGTEAEHPGREAMQATASRLLGRDRVSMHVMPGPPWGPEDPGLPIDTPWTTLLDQERPSERARALASAPRADVEPRFLTEGMHFVETAWGSTSVVTHEARGSLFWLDLEFPRGVRDDPFVCDAARMLVDRWQQQGTFPELRIGVHCKRDATTFEVQGVPSTFDTSWNRIWDRIDNIALEHEFVRDHVQSTLAERRHARGMANRMHGAINTYALPGKRGLQHHMPSDEALGLASPQRFEQSLRDMAALTPWVGYAGPQPNRLLRQLPPPRGKRGVPAPADTETLTEHTFYVLDVPDYERVDAHLIVDWITGDARQGLFADLYAREPGPMFDDTLREDAIAFTSLREGDMGLHASPEPWGFDVAHESAADLLVRAVADYADGADARWYERARADVESAYRNHRYARINIPRYVRSWSSGVDPRLARWSEMGHLTPALFADYAKRMGRRPLRVAIVADVSRMDLQALEDIGRVVIVAPEDALRDVRERDEGP